MLTVEERQKLTKLVAELYDFTDGGARGRRVLLQQANLGRFVPQISNLNDAATTVAADIVGRLENFGALPEEPTKHALGALLSYLLTLGDLPQDRAAYIAGIIVRYSLVSDPLYVGKLREQYGVAETAVRPPGEGQQRAPAPSKPPGDEPEFTVAIADEKGLEEVIGKEDNFLDVYWLFGAIYSSQAVCRIEHPEGTALGTGFLIGPDLLLTNQHVLKSEDYLEDAVARFDYREDATGVVKEAGRVFKLQPGFYHYSAAEELDYALVRLTEAPLKHLRERKDKKAEKGEPDCTNASSPMDLVICGGHRGYLVLRGEFIKENDRMNIIQHPDGDPMKVVMTQNRVVGDMSQARVQYVADTMGGSSGSPVFNRKWEVVALHHSGKPYPPESVFQSAKKAWKGSYRVNEGIPVRALLADFKEKGLDRFLPRD